MHAVLLGCDQVVLERGPRNSVGDGLPPGLQYDDSTRRISGRPTLAGIYTVGLRAINGVPPADAQISTVEIRNPPLQIVTPVPLSSTPLIIAAPV